MSGPRIFIIVLILFAVLFIVAMGIGLHQNDSIPDPDHVHAPWANSLSDWLSPKLDLNTVQGPCLHAAQKIIVLAAGSGCVLKIPSSKQKYGKAKFHLLSGGNVALDSNFPTTDAQDRDLSKQHLSWPGQDQSLVVLANGGSITISCGFGVPCQLQIE